MLFSLVYVSAATFAFTDESLNAAPQTVAIQAQAVAANQRLNVRGLLVAVAGHFLQWLQGEEAVVRRLMSVITADSRHRDVTVLYEGYCASELSHWSMTLFSRAPQEDYVRGLIERYQRAPEPDVVPAELFRRIVQPPTSALPSSRRKVVLFGQTGLWTANLMATLSTQWNVPVARTRMVGSTGMEREAVVEYLDAEHPRLGPLRLVNVAGDALFLRWLPDGLQGVHAAALLVSVDDPAAAASFVTHVMTHLGTGHTPRPILCLFGRTAASLKAPVQQQLALGGHAVDTQVLSLADIDAVWRALEKLIGPAEAAAQPPAAKTPLLAAMGPLPAPAARPAASPPKLAGKQAVEAEQASAAQDGIAGTLSPAGAEWMARVLALDAVENVALQEAVSGRTAMQGQPRPVPNRAALRGALASALTQEAQLHKTLFAQAGADWRSDIHTVVTRMTQRITVSANLRCANLTVVWLIFADGWVNEGLSMWAVRELLASAPGEVFV